MNSFPFTKDIIVDQLASEIQKSNITIALERIDYDVATLDVTVIFKAALSQAEQDTLTALVAAHVKKPVTNAMVIGSIPPMASKTLATGEKLFKRVHGVKKPSTEVVVGENIILWPCPYNWVKFIAIEFIGSDNGDSASLEILDKAANPLYGIPNLKLNQFGFAVNLPKDFYKHESEFDADLYKDLQVKIIYHSITQKDIKVNLVMNEVKP